MKLGFLSYQNLYKLKLFNNSLNLNNLKSYKFQKHFSTKLNSVTEFINSIKHNDKLLSEMNYINQITVDDTAKTIAIEVNLSKDHRILSPLLTSQLKLYFSDFETKIQIKKESKPSKPSVNKTNLSKIKHFIAVSSCKGGVGKSTVAVNLAVTLMKKGFKVGIFDADIHGPSLPTLLKTFERQAYEKNGLIAPLVYENIKLMSYGFAAPGKRAVTRGPIVSGIVNSLLLNTDWGELDYLVFDFPPGTGDIQLTLLQEVKFTGAVIVTTPQRLSFIDVIKGMEMFDELKVPILACVENMSYFLCDECDKKHMIFGEGYVNMLKNQFGVENSFRLPIEKMVSLNSDNGVPFVFNKELKSTKEFDLIAESLFSTIKKIESLLDIPEVVYLEQQHLIQVKTKDIVKSINPKELRSKCGCAMCIEEFTGRQILEKSTIKENIYPRLIEPKGNYAVSVVWSDGHRSSIYPYKKLLSTDIISSTQIQETQTP